VSPEIKARNNFSPDREKMGKKNARWSTNKNLAFVNDKQQRFLENIKNDHQRSNTLPT
jgi:hypothetical protein